MNQKQSNTNSKVKVKPHISQVMRHIWGFLISKKIFFLMLVIMAIVGSIILIFMKNPEKLPDLIITLCGGAVAGLIGFLSAQWSYINQKRNEEIEKREKLITALRNEIVRNLAYGEHYNQYRPSNFKEIVFRPLETTAWDEVKKTNYANTILKEIFLDLHYLYLIIERYNSYCGEFITAKNKYVTFPSIVAHEGELHNCIVRLDNLFENPLKKELESCLSKLYKIMKNKRELDG